MNDLIAGILPLISKLFTDKVDVYRDMEEISTIGDIQVVRSQIYEDIDGRGDPWTKDDEPITDKDEEDKGILPILVFLPVSYKVQKGDWIVVKRLDENDELIKTYEGKANEPQVYPSHQEILIKHKSDF